jgi:hypothetical protein
MNFRDRFGKILAIFVTADGRGPEPSPDIERSVELSERIARLAQLDAAAAAPKIDFSTIYQQAGIAAVPVPAEEAIEMIAALANYPIDARKTMVLASLNLARQKTGATADSVAADATAKISALRRHIDEISTKTEAEIAVLREQINQKQQAIRMAKNQEDGVIEACRKESARLSTVVSYFGSASAQH